MSDITLAEYQRAAHRTMNASLDERDRLLDAASGLAEEAGEVLAHVRKHCFQRRPLDETCLREELGDALWCLAGVATALEMSLAEIAGQNLDKLAHRHPHGLA